MTNSPNVTQHAGLSTVEPDHVTPECDSQMVPGKGDDPVAMLEAHIEELEANQKPANWPDISDVLEAAIIVRDLCQAEGDPDSPDFGHVFGVARVAYAFCRPIAKFDEVGEAAFLSLCDAVDQMEGEEAPGTEPGVKDQPSGAGGPRRRGLTI